MSLHAEANIITLFILNQMKQNTVFFIEMNRQTILYFSSTRTEWFQLSWMKMFRYRSRRALNLMIHWRCLCVADGLREGRLSRCFMGNWYDAAVTCSLFHSPHGSVSISFLSPQGDTEDTKSPTSTSIFIYTSPVHTTTHLLTLITAHQRWNIIKCVCVLALEAIFSWVTDNILLSC